MILGSKKKTAVFLDRDGTINVEVDYLSNPDDFVLVDGSAAAIARLNEIGVLVIVVSNQSGVARGYFSEADVARVNEKMIRELEEHGARLDAIYYCPHHPDGVIENYRIECRCRKPGPAMVEEAQSRFKIDIDSSFVVGDHRGDVMLAKNLGARSVLVLTGHGMGEKDKLDREGVAPDRVARDLKEAVEYIDEILERRTHHGNR